MVLRVVDVALSFKRVNDDDCGNHTVNESPNNNGQLLALGFSGNCILNSVYLAIYLHLSSI